MKPSTVSFSIDDKPKGDGGEPFGPAYTGTFVCRVPTLEEVRGTLPLRVTARVQRDGAADAAGVMLPNYLFVLARVWLDSLSLSVPEWYEPVQREEAEDDEELAQAIMVAYRTLSELLVARKKKPALTSVPPSPSTLPRAATN